MAVYKCKMCGGNLEVAEGTTVCECEYCGSKQTVPTLDDEKKINLFTRANRLRFACEFDKAAGVYESIVSEFQEEAEAYWGLILCKYGIEYVDDPKTGRKIPTCHRSSFDSVMDDANFEMVMEYSDAISRAVYREEAKTIENLRTGIIEVSTKEKPYDIFICYKETDANGERTIDSVIAQDVYNALTEKGYRVFFSRISLEDKLGQEYEPYIFAALNSAKVMLAFGTDYEYYNAVWVKNEWSRFLSLIEKGEKKTLIPCYKGIDAYDMPKEFAKLQAQDMGKVGAVQDLIRGVDKLLGTSEKEEKIIEESPLASKAAALCERGMIFLEDGAYKEAAEYFNKSLDENPKNGEAYLGAALASLRVKSLDEMKKLAFDVDRNKNLEKALRYMEGKKCNHLKEVCDEIKRNTAENLLKKIEASNIKTKNASRFIAVGIDFIVAITPEGTAIACGSNTYGQCNVGNWNYLVAIAAGSTHTVGLRVDGTVVATGNNENGQCNVEEWENITEILVGDDATFGICDDGTVVSTNIDNFFKFDEVELSAVASCKLQGWENVIAIRKVGTVAVSECSEDNQRIEDIGKRIVDTVSGMKHTAMLWSDGTVSASGENTKGQCNVGDWRDITAIAAGAWHTIGLKEDGSVIITGEKPSKTICWENIVAIVAGANDTVGLHKDGKVEYMGYAGEIVHTQNWRITTAWNAKINTKSSMESKKRVDELKEKISEIRREIRVKEQQKEQQRERQAQIEKLQQEKKNLTEEDWECSKQHHIIYQLEYERANCGFFKGKERKRITEQLHSVELPKLEELKEKAEKARRLHQEKIHAQIKELQNDNQCYDNELLKLQNRADEIMTELMNLWRSAHEESAS